MSRLILCLQYPEEGTGDRDSTLRGISSLLVTAKTLDLDVVGLAFEGDGGSASNECLVWAIALAQMVAKRAVDAGHLDFNIVDFGILPLNEEVSLPKWGP